MSYFGSLGHFEKDRVFIDCERLCATLPLRSADLEHHKWSQWELGSLLDVKLYLEPHGSELHTQLHPMPCQCPGKDPSSQAT